MSIGSTYKPGSNIFEMVMPDNVTLNVKGTTGDIGTLTVEGDGYITGDFTVNGKLTVNGLIDPPGLVLDEQSSAPYDPSITGTEGLVWVRDDGYLIFTDQSGTDNVLGTGGGGSGVTSITTTADGLSSSETITPTTSSTGDVVIDLPNIRFDLSDQNVSMGPSTPPISDFDQNNTVVGANTLNSLTSGGIFDSNTVVGSNSFINQISSTFEDTTAVGYNILSSSTGNVRSTVIVGSTALNGITTDEVQSGVYIGDLVGPSTSGATIGANNVYIGRNAGSDINNNSSAGSVLIGASAGDGPTNIASSTVIGNSSVTSAGGTVQTSVAIGADVHGASSSTLSQSVLIGNIAGSNSTSTTTSVVVGTFAGQGPSTLDDVVALGYSAKAGTGSISIGSNSYDNGTDNIVIGRDSGQRSGFTATMTGSDNILIGAGITPSIDAGTNNILLGANSGIPAAGTSNFLSIDGLITADVLNGKVAIGLGNANDLSGHDQTLYVVGDGYFTEDGYVTGDFFVENKFEATLSEVVAIGDSGERIQLASTELTSGSVSASGNLALTLPTVNDGESITYNVKVKTHTSTGNVRDFYRGIVVVHRDDAGDGLTIHADQAVLEFNDANYTAVASISTNDIVITFTNNTATATTNTVITASIEVEDNA